QGVGGRRVVVDPRGRVWRIPERVVRPVVVDLRLARTAATDLAVPGAVGDGVDRVAERRQAALAQQVDREAVTADGPERIASGVVRDRHDPRRRALDRNVDVAGDRTPAAGRRNVDAVEHRAGPFGVVEVMAIEPDGLRDSPRPRSEEHTSELQSLAYLVCRLLL